MPGIPEIAFLVKLRAQWPASLGIVAGIAVVCSVLSRPWTGFNSPDSEFYASYAIFGGDVADRSIEPAYTWTRLGVIAPTRALVMGFGPWWGFGIWRFLLIAAFVGGVFWLVRRASSRSLAAITALLAGLGTVVLSYFGNTYLTGAVIALTSLLLAVTAWGATGSPRVRGLPMWALLAGALLGWLAMVNPYGMLLGLAMAIGIRIVGWSHGDRGRTPRSLLGELAGAGTGFIVLFGVFLLAGLAIFPGRSWLGTYLEWNGRLDYASFVGDWTTWQRDTALLVVVLSVAVAVIAVVAARSTWAWMSLAIATANIGFTALFMLLQPGPWLEAPTYVALLWPGAIAGIGLAVASLVRDARIGWAGWAIAVIAVPLMAWAGRWDTDVALSAGWVLLGALGIGFLLLAVVMRRGLHAIGALAVLWLVAAAIGGQVLANGRGQLGIYGQFPFRAAYVDFDAQSLMESRIAAQEFVLTNTAPGDRIAIWTDPARLTSGLAAMQLWGAYNNLGTQEVFQPAEAERLAELAPTVIAMYAPSREAVLRWWSSLPGAVGAQPPVCTEVSYLGIGSPTASVCITRLNG